MIKQLMHLVRHSQKWHQKTPSNPKLFVHIFGFSFKKIVVVFSFFKCEKNDPKICEKSAYKPNYGHFRMEVCVVWC